MKTEFEPLINVEIYHSYYPDGISRDFVIEPAASCLTVLRDAGLLFRKTGKGFIVLCQAERDEEDRSYAFRPLDAGVRLSFALMPLNSSVVQYSDLPIDALSGRMFRLSNLIENQQEGNFLLSVSTVRNSVSEADLVELRSQVFSERMESVGDSCLVEIIDERGRQAFTTLQRQSDGICECHVDLRMHHPGRFTMNVNGIDKTSFYASDELVRKAPFGVIDIFTGESVPPAYRFMNDEGKLQPKTYTVRFDKRETIWKYIVILKNNADIEPSNLSIDYPQSPVEFQREPPEQLADGTSAVSFISSAPLPLQKKPVKGIALKKKVNGGTKVCIENLPNPTVTSIKPDKSGPYAVSEVFVTI